MRFNLREDSVIHVFVVSENDGSTYSPFQGFNTCLFSEGHHSALSITTLLPVNAKEPYFSPKELLDQRVGYSDSSIMIIDAKYLEKRMSVLKRHPFVFFTCLKEEFDTVKEFSCSFTYLPFVISDHEESDVDVFDANIYKIDNFILSRVKEIVSDGSCGNELRGFFECREPREKNSTLIDISSRHHSVTRANEYLFLSLGYRFNGDDKIEASPGRDNYIDAMVKSYKETKDFIRSYSDGRKSDLVLYSPSIFASYYNFKSNFWNQIARNLKDSYKKDFIIKGLFRNPSYSGLSISIDNDSQVKSLMGDERVRMLLMVRKYELAFSSLAVTGLSIQNICPTIRLPNAINLKQNIIKDLESLSKSVKNASLSKFNRKFKGLIDAYDEEIDLKLIDIIKRNESITICSDAPIEWISVNEIPLMFTHEISKIHTTLGTQLLKTALNFSSVIFDINDLKNITIVRSFRDHDPIKFMLEESVYSYLKGKEGISINIIDVQSKEEFVSAVAHSLSSILIIDCHGNHGGNESNGWLQIGDERVDIWELDIIPPPIVLLSACLTAAIAGSHASVANGFLDRGAIAVLGTFLPVDAKKSSIFIGKLLHSVVYYLDFLKSTEVEFLTWRKLLSKVLKSSFVDDVLGCSENDFYDFILEEYKVIAERANTAIFSGDKDWFNVLLGSMSEFSGRSEGDVLSFLKGIGFLETMNYSQIGRPENILVDVR